MILRSITKTGSPLQRAAGFFLLCAFLSGASLAWAQKPAQPEAASGHVEKSALAARQFIAVTANPHATDVAVEVLRKGGSAVDAAIAAQFALNVVEPQSSGIGGGGFLLHYDAKRDSVVAYDGRETAPAKATADRFVDSDGKPRPFQEVVATGKAVGVPGLLAMLSMVHQQRGRLPWADLLAPAIRLAEQGFAISPRLHQLLQADRYLRHSPGAAAVFLTDRGEPHPVGYVLRQPALAATFRLLAKQGAVAMYRGPLADAMVLAVAASGGDLQHADLSAYRAREREAVCAPYRGYKVCGMPPPSSGGIAVLQLLGLLQRTPFQNAAPLSADAIHWFAEAGRLVFADRSRYLGDPDFVAIPTGLLSSAYLDQRATLIAAERSMVTAQPGEPAKVGAGGAAHYVVGEAPELPATTHLSIIDAEGNAVALTSSVEDAFGSRILVDGYFLNNQLTDFSFRPDGANVVAPGKRPLSSMVPTLVFDPAGNLYAVLGSPGGPRIINYVAKTLVGLIDWQWSADRVLDAPHFGSRNGPTELERGRADPAWEPALSQRGHTVTQADMTSGVHLIVRQGRSWVGAADPRREGTAGGE
jgi:gamma-glutamyltranspeptidase/glutathione hydrolase